MKVKGLHGCGAGTKTIVFGKFKRQCRAFTEIVPGYRRPTQQTVIMGGRIYVDEVIPFDGRRGYNCLVNLRQQKYCRVYHGDNEFTSGPCHVNGIENFWGYAKTRLFRSRCLKKRAFICISKSPSFRPAIVENISRKFSQNLTKPLAVLVMTLKVIS